MMFIKHIIACGALALGVVSIPAQTASASAPIHLVVGAAPGGTVDTMARLLADGLTRHLNRSVVVENRAGGNGAIAAGVVARAQPDGNTLYLGTSGYSLLPLLQANIPYDQDDLEPVAIAAMTPFLLFTGPNAPYEDVPEMVAYAKANPDALSAASGDGTTLMASELLKSETGINAVAVNYRSGAQAVQDISTGLTDYGFLGATAVMPLVRAGRVRVLGIASDERLALAPDVPTLAEQGIDGVRISPWTGIMTPAGTPPEVINTIAGAVEATTQDPLFVEKVHSIGSIVHYMGPSDATRYIADETRRYKNVAEAAGITPNP